MWRCHNASLKDEIFCCVSASFLSLCGGRVLLKYTFGYILGISFSTGIYIPAENEYSLYLHDYTFFYTFFLYLFIPFPFPSKNRLAFDVLQCRMLFAFINSTNHRSKIHPHPKLKIFPMLGGSGSTWKTTNSFVAQRAQVRGCGSAWTCESRYAST